MDVHVARMHRPTFPYELQDQLRAFPTHRGPWPAPGGGDADIRAGMHQRLQRSGNEAVVDEDIFFNTEFLETAFEIAIAVILDSMAQHQILRPRRRANWVGLHEAQLVERAFQCGGREKTT